MHSQLLTGAREKKNQNINVKQLQKCGLCWNSLQGMAHHWKTALHHQPLHRELAWVWDILYVKGLTLSREGGESEINSQRNSLRTKRGKTLSRSFKAMVELNQTPQPHNKQIFVSSTHPCLGNRFLFRAEADISIPTGKSLSHYGVVWTVWQSSCFPWSCFPLKLLRQQRANAAHRS